MQLPGFQVNRSTEITPSGSHTMSQRTNGHVILVMSDDQLRCRLAGRLTFEPLPPVQYSQPIDCLRTLEKREADYLCIVCDLNGSPSGESGMGGLELQRRLRGSIHITAFVFCTDHADLHSVVQAMRDQAIAVVRSSDEQQLVSFVSEGLHRCRIEFERDLRCRETLARLGRLNLGEHQVLQGIMAGKLNKEIAHELSLSTRTIEQRRREVFRKLDAHHPATLARKLIEAAHSPQATVARNEKIHWLETIRHDTSHRLPACAPHIEPQRSN